MKKSTIKKAVLAVVFSTSMLFSMNTAASAASINALEWVRDAYPNQWNYVLVKVNGHDFTQVWTSSTSYFLVKCEIVTGGKCWVSK